MPDVKIPFEFLLEIEDLINSIDLEKFDFSLKVRFKDVLHEINLKKKKLANREIFQKMKHAKGDEKEGLILDYLQNKDDIKKG